MNKYNNIYNKELTKPLQIKLTKTNNNSSNEYKPRTTTTNLHNWKPKPENLKTVGIQCLPIHPALGALGYKLILASGYYLLSQLPRIGDWPQTPFWVCIYLVVVWTDVLRKVLPQYPSPSPTTWEPCTELCGDICTSRYVYHFQLNWSYSFGLLLRET